MSLSFVEDRLSSVCPRGLCLLVGPTQGQKRTTVEKNKCESTNMLITWAHADILQAQTLTCMEDLLCKYAATWNTHVVCFMEWKKMHMHYVYLKIHTCRCPHLEILWDTVDPLFLLSAWWATGLHEPAWPHRHGAPGLEEVVVVVVGGWQGQ